LLRKFHEARVNNKPEVSLWGTGSARREFLYADDLADACIFLLQQYDETEIVNVGCGEDLTIRELAEKIQALVGYTGRIVWDSSKPDGTPRKLLDTQKINRMGWKPRISLEEGLKLTYAWWLSTLTPNPVLDKT
jgi:GDP-L-fucose synthase